MLEWFDFQDVNFKFVLDKVFDISAIVASVLLGGWIAQRATNIQNKEFAKQRKIKRAREAKDTVINQWLSIVANLEAYHDDFVPNHTVKQAANLEIAHELFRIKSALILSYAKLNSLYDAENIPEIKATHEKIINHNFLKQGEANSAEKDKRPRFFENFKNEIRKAQVILDEKFMELSK